MRNKRVRRSGSFSDDDVPLNTYKMNGYARDPNSYDSLCQRSDHACEFCDEVSMNKYSSLIHNAKHIIIPLLNQNVYQCGICLYHFTSQHDLRMHTRKKHPEIKIPQTLVKEKLNECPYVIDLTLDSFEPKTEVVVNCQNIGFKNQVKKSESIMNQNEKSEAIMNQDEKSGAIMNQDENKRTIQNRLLFEDDVVLKNCNRLLDDLTKDCKVNLELFKPPCLDADFREKTVHYDELVKPGVYRCKKCGKGFPIRYDAIIHESSHLTFKNSQITLCVICKQYILGNRNNLRLHYLSNHREKPTENRTLPPTENRKLPPDPNCNNTVSNNIIEEKKCQENLEKRKQDKFKSTTLMLCDLCFSFCRNKAFMNYEYVGDLSELGKRYPCVKCGSMFFEINLVRRKTKCRKQSAIDRKKKGSGMSNKDRLKIIQHRFKMLKKN